VYFDLLGHAMVVLSQRQMELVRVPSLRIADSS
jgi:hypothetical protein